MYDLCLTAWQRGHSFYSVYSKSSTCLYNQTGHSRSSLHGRPKKAFLPRAPFTGLQAREKVHPHWRELPRAMSYSTVRWSYMQTGLAWAQGRWSMGKRKASLTSLTQRQGCKSVTLDLLCKLSVSKRTTEPASSEQTAQNG